MKDEKKKIETTRTVKALRVKKDGVTEREQPLADEGTVELYINGRYVAGLVCTMERVKEMLVGFLFSEGIIMSLGELRDLNTDDGIRYAATVEKLEGGVRPKLEKAIIASGCGHAIVLDGELPVEICHKEIDHDMTYSKEEILEIGHTLVASGGIHKDTRGTHGAAILQGTELVVAAEDISRHNAVDKVVGHCRLKNITLKDKVMATTGRISTEIVRKLIRNRMHIVVSRTVPTAAAVDLADHFMVTTIGAMTMNSFTVYTHPFRVKI
ncbi:formate dehydrogenase accessory sulfurtransferase FdhD [bacterium]